MGCEVVYYNHGGLGLGLVGGGWCPSFGCFTNFLTQNRALFVFSSLLIFWENYMLIRNLRFLQNYKLIFFFLCKTIY